MNSCIDNRLKTSLEGVVAAARCVCEPEGAAFIEKAARMIADCYRRKNKVIIAGNGGSLCDSMHFAEELVGQFRRKRPALPAIALSDPGILTCVGNDMGFEEIFARGIEAFGIDRDLLVVLTTSGNSRNIVRAVQAAKDCRMQTIAFLGQSGGQVKGMCDLEWIVSGFAFSDRIQEAHMAAIHVIIESVEQELFYTGL
jgi:D-sedoheptulose 7-phosphate isomerase